MLGVEALSGVLGIGMQATDPTAGFQRYVKRLAGLGVATLLVAPGSKLPDDVRTDLARKKDQQTWDSVRAAVRPHGLHLPEEAPAGLHLATRDPLLLSKRVAAYRKKYGDDQPVNIGIEAARSRLLLVDVDTVAELQAFRATWLHHASIDPANNYPLDSIAGVGPTVRSPGKQNPDGTWAHKGGGHWYFWVPETWRLHLPLSVEITAALADVGVMPGTDLYETIELIAERSVGQLTVPGSGIPTPFDGVDPGSSGFATPNHTVHTAGWTVFWRNHYVLAPPSVRAEGAYEARNDCLPAPQWLLKTVLGEIERSNTIAEERAKKNAERDARRAARAVTPAAPVASVGSVAAGVIDDDEQNIYDEFAFDDALIEWYRATPWDDILGPFGWIRSGFDKCGCEIWARPGNDRSSDKSATAHIVGCTDGHYHGSEDPPIHFWTTNPGPEIAAMIADRGSRGTLSKLQVYAALQYGGDFSTASREMGLPMGRFMFQPPELPLELTEAADVSSSAAGENVFDIIDRIDAGGFWASTHGLRAVDTAARANGVGRWGLLGAVIPRVMATVPPHVRLVKLNGREGTRISGGSLNSASVLIGPPEIGKSETITAAAGLVPAPDHADEIPEGTGEGIAKSFAAMRKRTTPEGELEYAQHRITDTVIVIAEEITSVTAEMGREGSKLGSFFRKAMFGQKNGTTTGELDRRTNLAPHTYRLAMIMGAQPETVGPFFAEGITGTPQRILWLPASAHEPDDTVEMPPPLELPVWPRVESPGNVYSDLVEEVDPPPVWIHRPPAADAAIRAVRAERIRTNRAAFDVAVLRDRDDEDELRGHELLFQLKIAVALAVMDGLREPTDLHWLLAGQVMEVRWVTVRFCLAACEIGEEKARNRAGRGRGQEFAAAKAAEAELTDRLTVSACKRVLELLADGPATKSELAEKMSKSQRGYLKAALAQLLLGKRILADGHRYRLAPYIVPEPAAPAATA